MADDTEIPVEVTIHTTFFGDIKQANRITVVREDAPLPASPEATPDTRKEWRVDWSPSLIFAELDDKSLVHFFTDVPQRGSIFDRNGKPAGGRRRPPGRRLRARPDDR